MDSSRSSINESSSRAAKLARDLALREQELAEQRREIRVLKNENGDLKQRLRSAEEELQLLTQRAVAAEQAVAVSAADGPDNRLVYLEGQIAHLRSMVTQVQQERDSYFESWHAAQLKLEKCSTALLQSSNNETIANTQLMNAHNQLTAVSQTHQQDAMALGRQIAQTEQLSQQLESYKQKELELVSLVATTQTQLAKAQQQTAELRETMLIRDETIAELRRGLTTEEEQLAKPQSREYTKLLEEMDDLRKENEKLSAESQRMQTTIALNKDVLADTEVRMGELQRELTTEKNARQALARKGFSARDESNIRKLLDEIHTLKLENSQLTLQHQGTLAGSGNDGGGRTRADALDAERMKSKKADMALRALQKRVSYLLQLTEYSNKLAARWQEQKQLLTAQLTGLRRANQELRNKLLELDGAQHRQHDGYQPAFQTEVEMPLAGECTERDELTDTMQSQRENATPQSVAAWLEKAVFDTNIALACDQNPSRSTGRGNAVPELLLVTLPDGTMEVKVDPNDMSGQELMAKIQLKSFVRFCQSTASSDPVKACLQKMVSVINNTRALEHQATQKAARAKMEHAKLAAQLTAWQLRLVGLKQFWNETKLSRHKITIKYVKELLVNYAASETSQPSSDGVLRSGASALKASQQTLSAQADAAAADLRLAGCMMDDETVYNVLRVIGGTLDDRETDLTRLGPGLQHVMLDQPILLMNYGHVARIVRLDLSNNYLTDIAAKLLAELVERATALCYLDLQKNAITGSGVNLLKEAIRRNKTILCCSTYYNGFYLEGVRETSVSECNAIAAALSEPRSRKSSLTVDVRMCSSDKELMLLSIDAAVQESAELTAPEAAMPLTQAGRPPSSRKSARQSPSLSRTSPERRPANINTRRPRSALVRRLQHLSSKPGRLCADDEGTDETVEYLPRNKLGGIVDERIRAMKAQGASRSAQARPQSAPIGSAKGTLSMRCTTPVSRQASPIRAMTNSRLQSSRTPARSRTPDQRSPGPSNLTRRTIDVIYRRPISAKSKNLLNKTTGNSSSTQKHQTRSIRGIKGNQCVQGVLF